MNSVYPANHFGGYPGVGGSVAPGGAMPGGAGFAGVPAGSRMVNMSMVSRLSTTGPDPGMGQPRTLDPDVKLCAGCGGRIVERVLLHSMDRFWHETCLKCNCCAAPLADSSSCYIKSGMILCRNDYFRMFGSCGQCAACGQTIPPSELVMRAGGGALVFHVRCFCCSKCSATLSRGDRYLLVNGALVCEHDASKLLPAGANGAAVKKGKVGRPRRQRD